MSDICQCLDVTCPSRKKCLRYMGKSDKWTAYADFGQDRKGQPKCFWFIEWPGHVPLGEKP